MKGASVLVSIADGRRDEELARYSEQVSIMQSNISLHYSSPAIEHLKGYCSYADNVQWLLLDLQSVTCRKILLYYYIKTRLVMLM